MSQRNRSSARLDREEIVASALALADSEGLTAVTLRRVAAEWNVTPMALYWHFADKEALWDALVERMLRDVAIDGEHDIRSVAAALLQVLRAHPSLAEMVPLRSMRTESGIALTEHVLGLLSARGRSPEQAVQLSILLLDGLVGLVVRQPGELAVADPERRAALVADKRARLSVLDPERFPALAEAGEFFLGIPDEAAYYSRGLEALLRAVDAGHEASEAVHPGR